MEPAYGLNAFRGRDTVTPLFGTRSGACGGRDLRFGVGWTLGEALRFGVEATQSESAPADNGARCSARRRSSSASAPLATSRRPTVACGGSGARSRPRDAVAADGHRERPERPADGGPRRPGIVVTRAGETMMRAVAVFVGRAG